MTSNNDGLICAATSWGVALVASVILGAVLMLIGDWTLLQAIFVGAIVFIALGSLLSLTLCKPLSPPVQQGRAPVARSAPKAEAAPAASTSAPAAAPTPSQPPAAEPAPEPEAPAPSAPDEEVPGKKPETLDAPRGGEADDLKKIKGIGPKLEQLVNSLGFYHYDQIANWTEEEAAWVDAHLENFKGRVHRDDWIAQAKQLASAK
jgi:predicted flap endonuclease-1-like 5' DNA nuclease